MTDDLTRRTGLTAEQRRARGATAGKAAHTISNYVKRISERAPDLTDADLEALRAIVGPVVAADVFAQGVQAGARLAAERIVEAVREVAA